MERLTAAPPLQHAHPQGVGGMSHTHTRLALTLAWSGPAAVRPADEGLTSSSQTFLSGQTDQRISFQSANAAEEHGGGRVNSVGVK